MHFDHNSLVEPRSIIAGRISDDNSISLRKLVTDSINSSVMFGGNKLNIVIKGSSLTSNAVLSNPSLTYRMKMQSFEDDSVPSPTVVLQPYRQYTIPISFQSSKIGVSNVYRRSNRKIFPVNFGDPHVSIPFVSNVFDINVKPYSITKSNQFGEVYVVPKQYITITSILGEDGVNTARDLWNILLSPSTQTIKWPLNGSSGGRGPPELPPV